MKVYLLIDDYTPNTGSIIYGIYNTENKAERRLKELENPENEYGQNMNEDNTIEIIEEEVE